MAAVTAGLTFAPWASSGARSRTSYEVVDVADRAGVVPSALDGVTPAWFLVPVLCGLVLVCIAAGRVRLAALLGATLGAFVTAGGVLVARSPLTAEFGATAGIIAGGCTVLAGIVVVAAHQTGRGDDRSMGSDEQR